MCVILLQISILVIHFSLENLNNRMFEGTSVRHKNPVMHFFSSVVVRAHTEQLLICCHVTIVETYNQLTRRHDGTTDLIKLDSVLRTDLIKHDLLK